MTTTDLHGTRLVAPGSQSQSGGRSTVVGYWAASLFVALTALVAGTADVLHAQPLYGVLLHLGYPSYFATLLGFWKIAGALVLLAPRWPLVKEWAYAGMFLDYSAATISHLASGDGAAAAVGPIFATAALTVSWWLRPTSRRLR
jgi:hypothetical protein